MPRLVTSAIPIGDIKKYGGGSTPNGFLLCDGSVLNAMLNPQYQDLYNIIGNTYGGTNNTNFQVPDSRGRTIIGAGQGAGLTNRALGSNVGEENHILLAGEMRDHKHYTGICHLVGSAEIGLRRSGTSNGVFGDRNISNQNSTMAQGSGYQTPASQNETQTDFANANNGSSPSDAHNNMQPSLAVTCMIRY